MTRAAVLVAYQLAAVAAVLFLAWRTVAAILGGFPL